MSDSLSLYRRHRPGSFDEVVGQPHIVRTLRNAVEQDKVSHAYLFVGSRGTGKTSMAKILARSLNCERGGPRVDPCGECESCRSIAAGSSVDVIEMDAASNRSVDDIRDLRERVAYAPTGGGWKVYILDEAHMLTKEAWNAFLKTLEEPPPSTVFVLATTEAHKVMPTIADRCQRFDFQRPSLEQVSEVMRRVTEAEGIEIEPPAISMVARSAAGSFRDALGTLDQLVAFNGHEVGLTDVLEVLGAVETDLLLEVVDAIAAEDPRGVLSAVEKLARSGRDVTQFGRDLLEHLRALVMLQTAGSLPESMPIADSDAEGMRARTDSIGTSNLMRTIDEVAGALGGVRAGDDPRMAIEIALLKSARPDLDPSVQGLARRLERIERRIAGTQPPWAEAAGQPGASAGEAAAGGQPGASAGEGEEQVSREGPQSGQAGTQAEASGGEPAPGAPASGGASSAPEAPPNPGVAPDRSEAGAKAPEAPAGEPQSPQASTDEPQSPEASTGEPQSPEAPTRGPQAPDALEGEEESTDSLTLDEVQRAWPAVVDQLRSEGQQLLAALFDGARPVRLDSSEGKVEIGFPGGGAFNKRQAEESERRRALASALQATFGEQLRPSFTVLDAEEQETAEGDELGEEELVRRLKSEFNAEEVS